MTNRTGTPYIKPVTFLFREVGDTLDGIVTNVFRVPKLEYPTRQRLLDRNGVPVTMMVVTLDTDQGFKQLYTSAAMESQIDTELARHHEPLLQAGMRLFIRRVEGLSELRSPQHDRFDVYVGGEDAA